MLLKIDLHLHTGFSKDSLNSVREVNLMCHRLGLDGYAVCDHDTLSGLHEASESSKELLVIPGIEVTARGAHILCLQPNDIIPRNRSIDETADLIHSQGGIAILAHPYGLPRSWVNLKQVMKSNLDAIEVANASQWPYGYITHLNQNLAQKLHLPGTGGSDSHIPETVGRTFTLVDAESKEVECVVKAIINGKIKPMGSGISWRERISKIYRSIKHSHSQIID